MSLGFSPRNMIVESFIHRTLDTGGRFDDDAKRTKVRGLGDRNISPVENKIMDPSTVLLVMFPWLTIITKFFLSGEKLATEPWTG